MKSFSFEPIPGSIHVPTQASLLEGLLTETRDGITAACGGRGMCATCHVMVEARPDLLTPMTAREEQTLHRISGCAENSRLACQARVLGDGVIVKLPDGVYIERSEDLLEYLGKRAKVNVLHPITGEVLVPKGKIITRSRIAELSDLEVQLEAIRATDV